VVLLNLAAVPLHRRAVQGSGLMPMFQKSLFNNNLRQLSQLSLPSAFPDARWTSHRQASVSKNNSQSQSRPRGS
jgi:hypothetical protein